MTKNLKRQKALADEIRKFLGGQGNEPREEILFGFGQSSLWPILVASKKKAIV